jgi:hypothetical protein
MLYRAHLRSPLPLSLLPRLRPPQTTHPRHAMFTNFTRIEPKGQRRVGCVQRVVGVLTSSNVCEGKNEKCVFYFLGLECCYMRGIKLAMRCKMNPNTNQIQTKEETKRKIKILIRNILLWSLRLTVTYCLSPVPFSPF